MEFNKNKSIYLQIVDYISESILRGQFQEGAKILSVREMAAQIGVNPNTVMRSYTHLQELGIIYIKRGIGVFVADQASENIKKKLKARFLKQELPEIVKKMQLLEIDISELEPYLSKINHKS